MNESCFQMFIVLVRFEAWFQILMRWHVIFYSEIVADLVTFQNLVAHLVFLIAGLALCLSVRFAVGSLHLKPDKFSGEFEVEKCIFSIFNYQSINELIRIFEYLEGEWTPYPTFWFYQCTPHET